MKKQAAEKQLKIIVMTISRRIANTYQSGHPLISRDYWYVGDCNV